MANVDLHLTGEEALRELGREVDHAIARIRAAGEELSEQLRAVAAASAGELDPTIAGADHAVLVDFDIPSPYSVEWLRLELGGGFGPQGVRLAKPIKPGRYRAVLLVSKVEDQR